LFTSGPSVSELPFVLCFMFYFEWSKFMDLLHHQRWSVAWHFRSSLYFEESFFLTARTRQKKKKTCCLLFSKKIAGLEELFNSFTLHYVSDIFCHYLGKKRSGAQRKGRYKLVLRIT
jgi:hypothetical protein